MPVSSFTAVRAYMNYYDATTPHPNDCYVGSVLVGGSKVGLYRGLMKFDLASPVTGDLIAADALIGEAHILATASNTLGTGGWAGFLERIDRADWDYLTACWNNYKTGSPWTSGGGDVATPPPADAFTAPAGPGDFTASGLAENVRDAIANRAELVHLRWKADNEGLGSWIRISAATLYVTHYTGVDTPVAEPIRRQLERPRAQPGRASAGATPPARPVRPVRPTRGRP